MGSRLRPARRPGLDLARLLGPRRRPVHELARQEPHAAAAPARRGSTGPTTSRGSTIRAGTTAAAASTCGGTRPTTRTDFVREQETKGDFPGGLKDLNTDNPDSKEALIRCVRVLDRGRRLRRLPHRHRQAHRSPRGRSQHARLLGRVRRSHAREGEGARQAELLHLRRGVRRQGRSDRRYTWGGTGRGRASSAASTRCSTSRRSIAASTPCSAQGQPTKNLECLYNSRIGRNPTDAWCKTNGYPQGPDYQPTPHAASRRRRHRPRAAAGARQLPRQPRPAALHVREDRSERSCASRSRT